MAGAAQPAGRLIQPESAALVGAHPGDGLDAAVDPAEESVHRCEIECPHGALGQFRAVGDVLPGAIGGNHLRPSVEGLAGLRRLIEAGCVVVKDEPDVPRCYVQDPFGLIYNLRQ